MLEAHLIGYEPLHGRRVSLVRHGPEHAAFLFECYRDRTFMDLYRLAQKTPASVEALRAQLLEEHKHTPQDLRKFEWVVMRHGEEGMTPIGLVSVADYSAQHSRGEFLVGVAKTEDRTHGISLEATLLGMEFAFNRIRLHKLMTLVYGHNRASQRSTMQLGFRCEGHLRGHVRYPSRGFVDLYQNGMLETEFRASTRLAKLSQRMLGRNICLPPPTPEPLPASRLQAAQDALRNCSGQGLG